MKISGVEIRPGMILEHKDRLWVAVKTMHTKPGKGGAYMQVELRNLRDGSKSNERFRASENVERVRLDQRDYQYLYNDGNLFTFMNTETYEQINIAAGLIGDDADYLQDGMTVTIELYEDEPIGVALPEHVVLAVQDTEPVVRGQTAANSFKPAVLENGVRTTVPPFIGVGEKLVIATADGSYVRRAD